MKLLLRNRDHSEALKPPQIRIIENKFIKRVDDALLRYIAVEKNGKILHYLVRIINKTARKKKIHRISSSCSCHTENGIERLLDEIDIRQQLKCENLIEMYAVRDTQPFIVICSSMCIL